MQNYLVSWEKYETGDSGLSLLEGLEEVGDYLYDNFPINYIEIYDDLILHNIWFGEYYEVSMQKTNWADKTK